MTTADEWEIYRYKEKMQRLKWASKMFDSAFDNAEEEGRRYMEENRVDVWEVGLCARKKGGPHDHARGKLG